MTPSANAPVAASARTGWVSQPVKLGVGCLVVGILLSGCASVLQGEPTGEGGAGGPASYDHESGAEDVLVSIQASGGFVPIEYNLRNTPQFLLLGDGTAITAGPMIALYPGPAIRPLQSIPLTEDQIQELFKSADDAGLLGGEVDYGEPLVTDVDTTFVSITVGGVTVTQAAFALGFEDEAAANLTEAQRTARTALQGFIDAAQALVGSATASYPPSGIVAYRLSVESSPPIEEPELQQPIQPWPLSTAPALPAGSEVASCLVVSGADVPPLLEALETANELTPWQFGADPPVRMAFRALLPGGPGCE